MTVVCFDLDDTLYKEIDFLKSAYKEIAFYAAHIKVCSNVSQQVLANEAFDVMMDAYQKGDNAFEALNKYLGLAIPVSELLKMYRAHIPCITLHNDVCYTLDKLKSMGILMGIVTDGREQTQWNKVRALGLTKWVDECCIIINSSPEFFKPNSRGFECVEKAARDVTSQKDLNFVYVGDNLKKDFVYPKQKGWQTICLRNDGRNIHEQNFEHAPKEALPDRIVEVFSDLIEMLFDEKGTEM